MSPPGAVGASLKRFAALVFVATAFGFLGLFIARNAGELRDYDWSINPLTLLASLLVQIVGLACGVLVWQLLLRRSGASVAWLVLARIWFVSGLARYIPGKIWHFVGAAHLGTAAGLTAVLTVTSLAVHTGIFVVGGLLTAALLVPSEWVQSVSPLLSSSRWLLPFALLLVHPRVIGGALAWARRFGRRDLAEWTGSWLDGILLLTLAVLVWFLTGAAFHLFVRSLGHASMPIGASIFVNAVAFVAGYLAFFVPAGLGAKEGALAALLSLYLPPAVAAVIAISSRLWTVAGEVIPALVLLRARRTSLDGDPKRRAPAGDR